jgi:rhodanese-related sulfurtransferase
MRRPFDLAGQPRISVADARRLQEEGKALVVDVRTEVEYQKEHLAGAVSLPLRRLRINVGDLPRDLTLITYCD